MVRPFGGTWPVELKYKELKSRFAMEEFSGATATSIIQEFYINMPLSNLVSLIKNNADEEIDITSKSSNKYRYQANRAFIIGRIKIIFPKILCGLSELSVIEKLYKEAVRCRSQILPGRSFPRKKLRWCTDRLKIQPVNNFIKNKIVEHGEIILVIGTRKAESTNRARTMAKYEKLRVRELLSPNPTLANELVFSPLENWKDDDVWIFLMQYKNPWGLSNHELQTLYMSATEDNECPMMVDKDLPSCGKSRFGCWVCTMVEKDKSMEAMISNDDEKAWMTPLLEFRNMFGDEENDRARRSFRKMQGYVTGTYERLHHGPYLKEIREQWLKKLLEIQLNINQNGPEEFSNLELISIPELRCIRRIWVKEKHEFDDSLPEIYKEVTGKEFDDPEWISNESFGKYEWDILRQVCADLYPNEELSFEMMYSLIDTEASINSINERKGILNSLESCIKKTFYSNEDDATLYYREQLERKKTMGGKYNEKFFITFKDESNEFEEGQTEVTEQ